MTARHVWAGVAVAAFVATTLAAQASDAIVQEAVVNASVEDVWVTAKMFGFSANDESQKMRAFFERGNRATLDSLVKRFAKP